MEFDLDDYRDFTDEEREEQRKSWHLDLLLQNMNGLANRYLEGIVDGPIMCYCSEFIRFANDEVKRVFIVSILNKTPNWKLLGKHEKCLDIDLNKRSH